VPGDGTWDNAALIAGCLKDEPEAWRRLVERQRGRIVVIARVEFGFGGAEAEDVAQEVLVRARARLGQLRDPAALGAWLAQLTRRLCLDAMRRRDAAHELSEHAIDLRASREMESVLTRLAVDSALRRLPGPSREVIERFFLRDESYATIGRALELPPGTIASRIARGLDRLREEFAAEAA
jgi:RNA polymerase sigma-70 factor (ECF subfamily)